MLKKKKTSKTGNPIKENLAFGVTKMNMFIKIAIDFGKSKKSFLVMKNEHSVSRILRFIVMLNHQCILISSFIY